MNDGRNRFGAWRLLGIAMLGCLFAVDGCQKMMGTSPGTKAPNAGPDDDSAIIVDQRPHVYAKVSEDDMALFEAGFRFALQYTGKDESAYLSLSERGREPADPPPELLKRLADLNLDLEPESERDGDLKLDFNKGKPLYIYWVTVKQRISDTEVNLNVGRWAGMLAGGLDVVDFELSDGKWVMKKVIHSEIY